METRYIVVDVIEKEVSNWYGVTIEMYNSSGIYHNNKEDAIKEGLNKGTGFSVIEIYSK